MNLRNVGAKGSFGINILFFSLFTVKIDAEIYDLRNRPSKYNLSKKASQSRSILLRCGLA